MNAKQSDMSGLQTPDSGRWTVDSGDCKVHTVHTLVV